MNILPILIRYGEGTSYIGVFGWLFLLYLCVWVKVLPLLTYAEEILDIRSKGEYKRHQTKYTCKGALTTKMAVRGPEGVARDQGMYQ